jgi:hypothetical protein
MTDGLNGRNFMFENIRKLPLSLVAGTLAEQNLDRQYLSAPLVSCAGFMIVENRLSA